MLDPLGLDCEPLGVCWEANLSPPEEQPVLLTRAISPALGTGNSPQWLPHSHTTAQAQKHELEGSGLVFSLMTRFYRAAP